MKKQIIFEGAATALITPFKSGKIDYPAFERLIEMQISAGISALVVGGTTGEAATLDDAERYSLFKFSKELCRGRTKLIFGTGTNDTKKAMLHTALAEEIGCDAVLVVTPYYNKGTDEGLVRHYLKIADTTALPVILYNVPARTGVNLSLSQLKRLSEKENIVAIKEASTSLDRLVELSLFGESLGIYAGCDSQIHSVLSLGGLGVISVVSNVYPKLTVELCESFRRGDFKKSLLIQKRLLPFINSLFRETNPAPVKYAMSRLGLSENSVRLPLYTAKEDTMREIDERMHELDAMEKDIL